MVMPLAAYADRISVRPGETIAFKVSSLSSEPYRARLVRVVSGDPNPAGPGIVEEEIAADFAGRYPSRMQPVRRGSHVRVPHAAAFARLESVTAAALLWPTTPAKAGQGIIAKAAGDADATGGFALLLDGEEGLVAALGAGANAVRLPLGLPLRARAWYRVWMSWDAHTRRLTVGQSPLRPAHGVSDAGETATELPFPPALDCAADLTIATAGEAEASHFNGKIERPFLSRAPLDRAAVTSALAGGRVPAPLAVWDFAEDVPGTTAYDTGPHRLHGALVNLPMRGMKGAHWSGREMSWRAAPAEYAAIHFHDDDIYDCGWETDFTFTVPEGMRSGVYAARLDCAGESEMVPFYVPPPRGVRQSNVCVLVSTFTYVIYANNARRNTDDAYRRRAKAWGARPHTPDDHPDYGLSTYDTHSDGSGIAHSSRLRPMLNVRSGALSIYDEHGSGLRHFPADTHLYSWLEAMGHEYDVVTDDDLHAEGVELLAGYPVVLTGSHPEYHTRETLDALQAYTDGGGRLVYLGGNGFYWKVALHRDLPGVIEIRRGEGGIRAWASEPGEYYNAFDGEYGGLWRRNGRPPQMLAGVGFSAQGLFEGSYYRRTPASYEPAHAWVFDGVTGDTLGDHGLSGGGAAGFELDRADPGLGTPPGTVVLASSERHANHFVAVHEEQLTHVSTIPGGPPRRLVHADIVLFETPEGGAVFSVGSITFCGSLPTNGYDNDVSRLLDNVLRRFRDHRGTP